MVLCVGRIDSEKNAGTLTGVVLATVSDNCDVVLPFCGEGEGRESVKRQVGEHPALQLARPATFPIE